MEPASLAIGAFALVSLFNNAVECFEYIQRGRDFPRDFETALLKLDDAKLHLLKWGRSIGLGPTELEKSVDSVLLERNFPSVEDVKRVERRLKQILRLFAEAEVVSSNFTSSDARDLESIVNSSTGDDSAMTGLREKMKDLAIGRTKVSGLRKKAQWALYDEKLFRKLIADVSDLIIGLVEHFLPVDTVQPTKLDTRMSALRLEESETPKALSVVTSNDSETLMASSQIGLMAEAVASQPNLPIAGDTVPFRRDPDFVDRTVGGISILSQVQEKCSKPAARVALVGLGGIGKSQIAIQYAHEVRRTSPNTWVFWVHVGTASRFEEGYRVIAKRLKIAEQNDSDSDTLQLVYEWLSNESNGKWAMILDNVDDPEILFASRSGKTLPISSQSLESRRQYLSSYLPQSQNGSILVTTRSDDAAFRLTGRNEDIIKLEQMGSEDALNLLKNKLTDLFDEEPARELAELLEFMPLALNQAAAYIRQRAPRMSIERYVDSFRRSDRSRAKLLEYDEGDIRRDGTTSNSVIAALHISFDYIRETRPSAMERLAVMSFCDRQGIPEEMLWWTDYIARKEQIANEKEATGCDEDEIECNTDSIASELDPWEMAEDFEDDIATLTGFSLLTVHDADEFLKGTFKMHRLVQLSIRRWLEISGQYKRWRADFIWRLIERFPSDDLGYWEDERRYFPHVQGALAQRPDPDETEALKNWSVVMGRGGRYALNLENTQLAERMLRQALKGYHKFYGPEYLGALSLVEKIAQSLMNRGSWEEAEKTYRQLLAISEKIYGRDDVKTLNTLNNVAEALEAQGNVQEASNLLQSSVTRLEATFGDSHRLTLQQKRFLASLLTKEGRHDDLERYERHLLSVLEKTLGPDDRATLHTMDDLARTLLKCGKLEESKTLFRRALAGRRKLLGDYHSLTLCSSYSMAIILQAMEEYEEAEEQARKTWEAYDKTVGPGHTDTLLSIQLLGLILLRLERFAEALPLYEQLVSHVKEHPATGPDLPDLSEEWQFLLEKISGKEVSTASTTSAPSEPSEPSEASEPSTANPSVDTVACPMEPILG